MINYFNFAKNENGYLLTNDFGKYQFVSDRTFNELVHDCVSDNNPEKQFLVENGFLIEQPMELFVKENAPWLRSMKEYCLGGTSLHIFAVTNKCNLDCVYCQAHSCESSLNRSMTAETGRKAVEFAMQSPNKNLTFEFQGGEPLLNFEVVKEMIDYSKAINHDKVIQYTIVTNLVHLNDEMLKYLTENDVSICTSLDGPENVHDHNRPFRNNGLGSYKSVVKKITALKQKGIKIGAIQTTTNYSLHYPREIIDQYRQLGINTIFLRPLTPLGLADSSWVNVGYTAAEFLEFYRVAFEYIMEINMRGEYFSETHAGYFIKKIFFHYADNYMELRSPCGAGIGQMSYYHDGSVYTCDEGRMMSEMGDQTFRLGNVLTNTYRDCVCSPVCAAVCKASIVESLPKCAGCVYQPYCGVCPVVNYASANSLCGKNSKDFRCEVYKGIMDLIFAVIEEGDERKINILKSWAN